MRDRRSRLLVGLFATVAVVALAAFAGFASSARAFNPDCRDNPAACTEDPADGLITGEAPSPIEQDTSSDNPQTGYHDNGRGGNTFVNDPCLDPPPPARERTVQSETELAVLNVPSSMGKKIVAGYNDSFGFYDRNNGINGFSYSVNGGNTWIDGGGLPPAVPGPGSNIAPAPGQDGYLSDPVVIVHQLTQRFFYFSIYRTPEGTMTLSMNRGTFQTAPPTTPESVANTSCLNGTRPFGTPDTRNLPTERIVWERPVQIIQPSGTNANDFLDKEWAYVDQTSGTIYVTYTRFTPDGQTPLELVRCKNCAYLSTITTANWDGPYVIVPNELDAFNQATMPVTTPSGRVVATWYSRKFDVVGTGAEIDDSVQSAYSDTDGTTFTGRTTIQHTNPQAEPPGYNRRRTAILNAPYINVNKGQDDGIVTASDRTTPGYGNLYVTYFSGKTPVSQGPPFASQADIYVARSTDGGQTWQPVKVNDDPGTTSHVFPSVQVNKNGIIYVDWLDRRRDPANQLTDDWANVSKDGGLTYGPDRLQSDYATDWHVRADARPNFGDYNSSDLLAYNDFVTTWADGRFPPPAPAPQAATPDTIFTIANGLGVGTLSK